MNWLDKLLARHYVRNSRYRAQLEGLNPALYVNWQRSGPQEFPNLPTARYFFVGAAAGLMSFFEASSSRRQPCALPSLAADSVWHAWMRWDADDLDRFCRRYYGAAIAHLPKSELNAAALPRALVGCRMLEGMESPGEGLPMLFGLDARLRMPFGHGYWVEREQIVYQRLDAGGRRAGRAQPHPDLTTHALFSAHLISEESYTAAVKKNDPADLSSVTTYVQDDGGNDASVDCADSGGSDGGGDGGGDGGSACGGCGGGGGD